MKSNCLASPRVTALKSAVLMLLLLSSLARNASAHGMQYLLAKVMPSAGNVRVEITVDYAGNPLIETEAAAREAIAGILTMKASAPGQDEAEFVPLSKFEFRQSSEIDPTCPLMNNGGKPEGGVPHQLLTGVASFPVRAASLVFAVPRGNPNDAILWTVEEQPGHERQQFYLISGEATAPIPMPPMRSRFWLLAVAAAVICVAAIGLGIRRTLRTRPR